MSDRKKSIGFDAYVSEQMRSPTFRAAFEAAKREIDIRPTDRQAVTVGNILSEELMRPHGWTRDELETRSGLDRATIDAILDCETMVLTEAMAQGLARATGISSNMWMNIWSNSAASAPEQCRAVDTVVDILNEKALN